MKQYVKNSSRHVDNKRQWNPETIQKNGASPKSLMSRGNNLKLQLI
jgi:hypothetical protein